MSNQNWEIQQAQEEEIAKLREVNQKLLEALKTMRGSWVVRPDDKINQMIYRLANEAIAFAEEKK